LVLTIATAPTAQAEKACPKHYPNMIPNAQVVWLRRPSGDDLSDYYPRHTGVSGAGSARINCVLMDDGRLTSCRIVAEEPPGAGIGAATLRLAGCFQFKMQGSCAHAGQHIEIPIRFVVNG
jgi:hypothetical protein